MKPDTFINALGANTNANSCLVDTILEMGYELRLAADKNKRLLSTNSKQVNEIEQLKAELAEMEKTKKYWINNHGELALEADERIRKLNEEVEQLSKDRYKEATKASNLKSELKNKQKIIDYDTERTRELKTEYDLLLSAHEAKKKLVRAYGKTTNILRAKASKLNAEKKKMFEIMRGILKTTDYDDVIRLYDKWLHKRRKKSKKGGK